MAAVRRVSAARSEGVREVGRGAAGESVGNVLAQGRVTRLPPGVADGDSTGQYGAEMTTSDVPVRPIGLARWTPLWWLSLPAFWGVYTLAFDPTDRIADPTGACPWHSLFGIDGPSCGITRMTWYLLHGDLVEAARMHLAALLLVPVGGYVYVWWVASWVFGRHLPMRRPTRSVVIAVVTVFVVYSVVLRNLPWPPFQWFYVSNLT